MTQETQSAITPEVKAMIGVTGDVVESWGVVDAEYLRRFTQAVMIGRPASTSLGWKNATVGLP